MTNTREQILTRLSASGHRITKARQKIITKLLEAPQPLTVQALANRVDVDEASVYRTIQTLRDQGLVEEIVIRGGRAQFAVVEHHHHHAVCRDCGKIEHVPCDQMVKAPVIAGFAKLDEHEVTFYGRCCACA